MTPEEKKKRNREASRRWRAANPETVKRWAEANPEKRRELGRRWRADNKEKRKILSRRWYVANREKLKRDRLARCYSLSAEQWNTLLILQAGRCAACDAPLTKKLEPVVDHCHLTGKIRGLLCTGCNTTLGLIEHPLFPARMAYLERCARLGT